MSTTTKVVRWTCIFLIAFAVGQVISLFPWSFAIVGVGTTVAYMASKMGRARDEIMLQVVATGLVMGTLKCYVG
jgi:TM2 domain-containing membrane protein YozV